MLSFRGAAKRPAGSYNPSAKDMDFGLATLR